MILEKRETPANADRDLRAARFLQSLRNGRGLSPEQMGDLCGVGGSTIRSAEKGVIPQIGTQDRIATFLGIDKAEIWRRGRRPVRKRQPASQRAVNAVQTALGDRDAELARLGMDVDEGFALGVAWAVCRAQNPYADPALVTERALVAWEAWRGGRTPVPAAA